MLSKDNHAMNPFELFKNLQNMQSQMQEMQDKLKDITVTGSSGAGMVEITVNGKMEVQSITIAPEIVDPAEIGMLETLIASAFNAAVERVQEQLKDEAASLLPFAGRN